MDEKIADLKVRMEKACEADNAARETGQPALHKLKLLPQVTSLLTSRALQNIVVDPDTNFLQHVRFFLEPLNDGSLPAYNIQRDIFQALLNLPIEKESLRMSGIGKIILFYTKSKRPEIAIKRMAERLLGEWSRPILNRTHDYKKRFVETRDYDYEYVFYVRLISFARLVIIFTNANQQGGQTAPGSRQPKGAPSTPSPAEPTGCRARARPCPCKSKQPGPSIWPPTGLYYCTAQHLQPITSPGVQAYWC